MSVASSSQSPQRSVRDRLGSLFGSKVAPIADFHIMLDDPVKLYGPGETVTGTVILNVARPLGVTHVVVSLYGYVQVFKNTSKPKKPVRNGSGHATAGRGSRWTNQYYGDGYASLFEDEVVLSGDGRLDPRPYRFHFALKFPSRSSPTSIDFERGTISYVITSTITRPTSISPTTTCERKVFYRDEIDVGICPVPKPRVVDLKPKYHPAAKARTHARNIASKQKRLSLLSRTDTDQSSYVASAAPRDDGQSQRPASPSIASSHSKASSLARESERNSDRRSSQTSHSPKEAESGELREKMIVVTTQISKGGCLPGEVVSVTVSISHIKPIRSISGVIVTLYRQAGVDMHPNLPISSDRGGKGKYEDYYPRSKTGLGGLSLSTAGSSQEWRKDLCQTFKPFYINPESLSADVKVYVRVPDEAFPTMKNVPGDMIRFEYIIEVVVDIQGRLGQNGSFSSLTSANAQTSWGNSATLERMEKSRQDRIAWGAECVDTVPIRRENGVVSTTCELVIGTRDSERARGKQRAIPAESSNATIENDFSNTGGSSTHTIKPTNGYSEGRSSITSQNGQYWHQPYDDYYDYPYAYNYGYDYDYDYYHHYNNGYDQSASFDYSNMPIPSLTNEANLTEKQRIQLMEQSLFPSQPPLEPGDSSNPTEHAPTAPVLPEEIHLTRPVPTSALRPDVHAQRSEEVHEADDTDTTAPVDDAAFLETDSSMPGSNQNNQDNATPVLHNLALPPEQQEQVLMKEGGESGSADKAARNSEHESPKLPEAEPNASGDGGR